MGQREILLQVSDLLQKQKISFLLTGSFAVSYYGYPRATHDIDFIIEITPEDTEKLINTLHKLGNDYLFDKKEAKSAVLTRSQFDVFHIETGIKIDFWLTKKTQFERNKLKRKKLIRINKAEIPVVSAEDLILTKLTWCKEIKSERHLRDCVSILETQKEYLDKKYLFLWAKKLGVKALLQEVIKPQPQV